MGAAIAAGVCLGLAHQAQGLDLADSILAKLRGVPPTPSLARAAASIRADAGFVTPEVRILYCGSMLLYETFINRVIIVPTSRNYPLPSR